VAPAAYDGLHDVDGVLWETLRNMVPLRSATADVSGTYSRTVNGSDYVKIFGLSAIFGSVISLVIPTVGVALVVGVACYEYVAVSGFPCMLEGSMITMGVSH